MKKGLYFGLRLPESLREKADHCPLIQIVPIAAEFDLSSFTHYIITSRSTVEVLPTLPPRPVFAVGRQTARACMERGLSDVAVADPETAEGLVELMKRSDLRGSKLFYPHSKRSRPVIEDYLKQNRHNYVATPIYTCETVIPEHLPDLEAYDELFFTSPSTVDAFEEAFGHPPTVTKCRPIGPITEARLASSSPSLAVSLAEGPGVGG